MIIVILGLPGTGKSYLAERLAKQLGIAYFSSDRTRQQLQLQGKYDSDEKSRVYTQLLNDTEGQLALGKDVILDATFSDRFYLQQVKNLAQKYTNSIKLIEMVADEEVIRSRVSQSRKYSEADFEVYKKVKEKYDTIYEAHLVLDSSQSNIEQLIQKATKYLYYD